mgnify:CR=1 FL=1
MHARDEVVAGDPHPVGRKHAEQLHFRPAGVGQWAEQVEDRGDLQLLAHRHDVADCAVVPLGEQEAHAGLRNRLFDQGEVSLKVHAQGGQHVGRTGFGGCRAVAVLGDRNAGAGENERGAGRDIDRA